jgi:hypothetical protein
MSDYPEKTCSIERLVRHPRLVQAALAGQKTEQRRDGVYAYPGETFELDGVTFVLTDLKRETLGDMNDKSAQAEGYPSLDAYKNLILTMHKGMSWENDASVWVHCFKRKDA